MLNVKKTSFKLSRSRRIAIIVVSLVAILCGVSAAVSLAREQIAYVAGYAAFALLLLSIPFVVAPALLGIGMSVSRRTRWMGFVSLTWASLLITSFYITFKVLDSFGQVSYKHEKMVSIGPDVQANLVIYFNDDATHDEIQNFGRRPFRHGKHMDHGLAPALVDCLRSFHFKGMKVSLLVSFQKQLHLNAKTLNQELMPLLLSTRFWKMFLQPI